ncbi:MAG: AAA family ATPase [Candidatus ainarchaeum sp.]|jgi:archaeal cell division control protein 6|nr:AAA family ATPase [Candidatus ainarchaeum sp.]MDD4468060.1 AAA family ATPase [Candidatus ainarchaeum sp.]HPM85882.1 AAA family ATPase [archaeon]
MANVFESSKVVSLFKDERVLYPDFVPDVLPFRDEEVSELVFCLKPASIGRKPTNVFVFGKPGTGKTVTLKYVLNELKDYSDRAKGIYINCFEYSSKQSILARIANILGVAVPTRGVSSQEVFLRIIAVMKTTKVIPIIIFDEAEQLLSDDSTKDILYDLSRLPEQQKVLLGLVFISNDSFFLSNIDDRVKSSLQCSKIPFEPYTVPELKEILLARTKFAFFDYSLDKEVIPLCAAHAFKMGGDSRVALSVLLKAGRLAERKNSKTVSIVHVRASFLEEKPVKQEVTSNLSRQEKIILDYLSTLSKKEAESGELYKKFEGEYSDRSIRLAIALLKEKKLVSCKQVKKGNLFTRLIKKVN